MKYINFCVVFCLTFLTCYVVYFLYVGILLQLMPFQLERAIFNNIMVDHIILSWKYIIPFVILLTATVISIIKNDKIKRLTIIFSALLFFFPVFEFDNDCYYGNVLKMTSYGNSVPSIFFTNKCGGNYDGGEVQKTGVIFNGMENIFNPPHPYFIIHVWEILLVPVIILFVFYIVSRQIKKRSLLR